MRYLALSVKEEKQWLRSKGYVGKVTRVEPSTNVTNSFGYVFFNGKGMVNANDKLLSLENIIEDNFEPVKNPQVGDRLIYRDSSTQKPIYAAIVSKISDGKVSNVRGQLKLGGSIFEHHPDLIKKSNPCNWELLRPKEGASLKPWAELIVRIKDYVTSTGKSFEVFCPKENMPVIPLDLEKQTLEIFADKATRIGEADPAYNCFGHGILDKKGMIYDVDDIIKDDFTLVEIPQAGDTLVGRDPGTGKAEHMAVILKTSDGKVSFVSSKEGTFSLYMCSFDVLKVGYEDLDWEFRRKKPSVKAYTLIIE